MPTVIDSLIVELGLDPSKFTKGQKDAAQSFIKTKEQAQQVAKEIEESGQKAARFFSILKREALSMFGAYLTARGLKEFIVSTTEATAQAGRLAKVLDMNVKDLSKWQTAAKLATGSSAGMAGTLSSITREIQRFSLTGEAGQAIPYFRALGISIQDSNGHFKTAGDLLLELSQRIEGMDPARAAELLRGIGADENTIQLLIQGRKAVQGYLNEAQRIGPITDANVKSATHLQQAWSRLAEVMASTGRSILGGPLGEAMAKVLDFMSGKHTTARQAAEDELKYEQFAPLVQLYRQLTGTSPGQASVSDREAYIRRAASSRGINPDIAVQVARSEGLGGAYAGDRGSSFGDFQLHYGGIASGAMAVSGLGDQFTSQTGLDARNPNTWREQIDFALDQAAHHGWGPWHGWKGTPFAGIPHPDMVAGASGGGTSNTTVTHDTKIGHITINTQATDAKGIANEIGPAIEHNGLATQANYGAAGAY